MRLIPKHFVAVVLVGCFVMAIAVAGELECEGPYRGRTLTPEELATVLRNHQAWLASGRERDDKRRANLCQANLQKVRLVKTNLQGAALDAAKLQGAHLVEANLQEANLVEVNLQGAVYGPNPGKLPNFWTLTYPGNHLETLLFHDSPAALIALREAFKKGGMRT